MKPSWLKFYTVGFSDWWSYSQRTLVVDANNTASIAVVSAVAVGVGVPAWFTVPVIVFAMFVAFHLGTGVGWYQMYGALEDLS